MIIKLINFTLVFYPLSQLDRPQYDDIALPPQPPPPRQLSLSPFPPLSRLRTFGWLLCSVADFWPPKFTTYFFSLINFCRLI